MTTLITTQDLEPAVRLRDAFEAEGYATELLTAGERIAQIDEPVLLILTGEIDSKRSRRLIRETRELGGLPIIGLVDSPDEAAPEALRGRGLSEAFVKPIDPAEVLLVGRRLIERERLQQLTGIVGRTPAIQEALERVVQIAPVHSTVLITGESGTGKELIARGIHALSPRRHKPFIAANVAAFPESLLESELFGHEKGAFTGAVAQRKGFFELAHQGTLFLDEIGEMPLATQTKLLRVLEEREFRRVGGEQTIHVDVRVIAATNQDLRRQAEAGEFRRDLYFRLNVLRIELPPLRSRRADIPLLVDAFVRGVSREHDLAPVSVTPEALAVLSEYDWPGNIRELRNLVESMVVMAPGRTITPDDVPESIRRGRSGRALVRVPSPPQRTAKDGEAAPALEFVFRTLMELRMDVEDLRHEFEEYRRTHAEPAAATPLSGYPARLLDAVRAGASAIEDAVIDDDEDAAEDEAVVYRSGMTMQEMEKEAITLALRRNDGNRRKTAEELGIGERTLYRKIKEYDIPF